MPTGHRRRQKKSPLVGLIGLGYWGSNHLRTCRELPVEVCTCDHHGEWDYRDHRDLLENSAVDAVIVATPAETHHRVVKDALLAGKHVFVEKPFGLHEKEARDLIRTNKKNILMVGHLTCFDLTVAEVKKRLPDVGEVRVVSLERMGRYPNHHHADIISDLTSHDVATLTFLELTGDIYNAYDVPKKRLLRVEGEKGTLSTDYDHVYWNGREVYQAPTPHEPLRRELLAFLEAMQTGEQPLTDQQFGLTVVRQCDQIRLNSDFDPHRYVSYRPNLIT